MDRMSLAAQPHAIPAELNAETPDDRPTFLDPQIVKWMRSRREAANARQKLIKATTKIVNIMLATPKTIPCPPPLPADLSVDGCCAGKYFHTNECPNFVVSGRDWREGGAR